MVTSSVIVGIFVGGLSRRMGAPKGLLPSPEDPHLTLVERLRREVAEALPQAPCYLVGARPEYETVPLPVLVDELPGCGPLGGLVALLAEGQARGARHVLSLACDHPYLKAEFLRRLCTEALFAPIYCPRAQDKYDPLVARYRADLLESFRDALLSGRYALQPLLAAAGAQCISLSEQEESNLLDWDTRVDAGLEPE